jgi:hypothetical protein
MFDINIVFVWLPFDININQVGYTKELKPAATTGEDDCRNRSSSLAFNLLLHRHNTISNHTSSPKRVLYKWQVEIPLQTNKPTTKKKISVLTIS